MKEYRVKPSLASVTPIVIEGKAHHFFHSEVLGKCRAILVDQNENLPSPYATPPLSKGDKLEILMDCSQRLHERFLVLFDALHALHEMDKKNRDAVLATIQNVQKASRRVTRKITWLLEN